jgi:hypothetical protein
VAGIEGTSEGFGTKAASLVKGMSFKELASFLVLTIFPIRRFNSGVVILLDGTFKFRIRRTESLKMEERRVVHS